VACAAWLATHIDAIAQDEAAGEIFRDVADAVIQIERCINRPLPPRFLGPCPVKGCATRLTCERTATEVTCPECQATHSVEELVRLMEHYVRYEPYTTLELLGSRTSDMPGVLEQLNMHVARSTFYRWRKTGTLPTRGWRTRDGAAWSTRNSADDEPTFWVSDVQKLLSTSAVA
jgi:hypothetical protein